ncbi:TMhelix containing protein [Vibrio phage 1.087.A._10N.261.45.F9]|nr:TMhelix containing protein [Vibrio phage 1.087.A._10N.261.45.F9]
MHNNRRDRIIRCVVFNVRLGDVFTRLGFVGWGVVVMMVDIVSLCLGAFVGCWTYIAFSIGRYKIELSSWYETRKLACDKACMCGSHIDSHGWGDNHGVVSQLDWHDSNFDKPLFK